MNKIIAFIKKYKTFLALSLCFIFALTAGFLVEREELKNAATTKQKQDIKDTKAEETRAFIAKSNDTQIDKKYKEETIDVMPEERVEKNTAVPEAFPDSDYKPEPIVTKEDLEKTSSEEKPSTQAFSPALPIKGEKITRYSVSPIYSATLDDWRSHEGIDIASELGSEISASEKGTVTFVGKDPLLGVCIKISHANGYETLYANLHDETRVAEGQQVEKGQVIAHVGESSIIESEAEPHLHFELMQNGKRINPEEYIR